MPHTRSRDRLSGGGRRLGASALALAFCAASPASAGVLIQSHNENASWFAVQRPLPIAAKGAFSPTLEAVASVQEFGDRVAISFRYDGFDSGGDPDNQPSAVVVEVDEGMGFQQAFDLQPPPDFPPGEVLDLSFELSAARFQALDAGNWRLVVTDDHANVREVAFVEGWAYDARLSGNQEVPSNPSEGTGFGRVSYDPGSNLLWAQVRFSGLATGLTMAHIHGPAGSGANAPVIYNLQPNTGGTQGDVRAFLDPSLGSLADLYNGNWYFNLHTTGYPGGEIRGQIHRIFGSGFQPPQ